MVCTVKLTVPAERDAYQAFEYIRADALQGAEDWLLGLFANLDRWVS